MKFLTIYAVMEKEENVNLENTTAETSNESDEVHKQSDNKQELDLNLEATNVLDIHTKIPKILHFIYFGYTAAETVLLNFA